MAPVSGMASVPVVLAAAAVTAAFVTLVGTAVGRLVPLWAGTASAAPALGFAVFVALALPVERLTGFTPLSTGVVAAVALAAAFAVLLRSRGAAEPFPLPRIAYPLAAAVAFLPVAGLLPHLTDQGVILGPAASDHAKVAMIDAMTRLGLPPANPFFAAGGGRGVLSYYYLWHFAAAQLSLVTGVSGWEADAALTGVTAYASLLLMMGLALRIAAALAVGGTGRRGAVVALVAVIALTGGMRPVLGWAIGWTDFNRIFADYRDLESWMSQACWVPQHLAAANSALLVLLLIPALATRRVTPALLTGIVAAAAFGCSVWIGGVTLAAMAAAVGARVAWRAGPAGRRAFALTGFAAVAVAMAVAWPILTAAAATVGARGGGAPIAFHPYEVFGPFVPAAVRRALDLPGFWLVLLPFDLPALFTAGVATLLSYWQVMRRAPALIDAQVVDLGVAALTGLTVGWLFVSTIGNNDLGWRAVLVPTMVLLAAAAAGLAASLRSGAWAAPALMLALVAVGFPDRIALGNVIGRPSDDAEHFAAEPALWAAVRRHAGPADRVANNPLDLDDLTSFPVDVGWALLSDRPSCYSGWETAQVYVDLPKARVKALDDRFVRVFDGRAQPGDVAAMARDDGCRSRW